MSLNLRNGLENFLEKTKNINYEQNGAFKSELYCLYAIFNYFKCDFFIESGIDNGHSTKILLELLNCSYIGIDINSECYGSKIENELFTFICGDSSKTIQNLIENLSDKKIFIFIDGPKGHYAIEMKNKLLEYPNIKCVSLHDTYDGLENENHKRIFETKSNSLFNNKYFSLINQMGNNNINTIYNLKNNYSDLFYSQCYPNGPGISFYSNELVNFEI